MPSRITRRQCAALLAAAPAIAQVTSPSVPPAGSPAAPTPPASPQERMEKALADIRDVSSRLAKIEVPMDLEPAFAFHS